AQHTPGIYDEAVRVGAHVRLWTTSGHAYAGVVTRLADDSIAVNAGGKSGVLALATIRRMQLRVAQRSGYKAGFLIGGIVGMGGLLATELATEEPCTSFCT